MKIINEMGIEEQMTERSPLRLSLEDATDLVIEKKAKFRDFAGDTGYMLEHAGRTYVRRDYLKPPMYEMLDYYNYTITIKEGEEKQ